MATDSVELLALQRIDETCMQLQQQVRQARQNLGRIRVIVPEFPIFESTAVLPLRFQQRKHLHSPHNSLATRVSSGSDPTDP